MVSSSKFWDKLAEKYSKQPIKDIDAYEAALARTKSYLSDEYRALEIGCGTGSTAVLLSSHVKQLVATDISKNMIDIGIQKAKDKNISNIDFLQAEVFDDRLAPQSFDVILAHNILHLLEDLPQAMERLSELLKPGGLLISKTPCLGENSSMLKVAVIIMKMLGKAPYVGFVKGKELEDLMLEKGFTVVEKGQYPEKSHSHYFVVKNG